MPVSPHVLFTGLYNFCAITKGKGLDALLCEEIIRLYLIALKLVCGDLQSLALFHKINISCQILAKSIEVISTESCLANRDRINSGYRVPGP